MADNTDKDFLATARERMKLAIEATSENRVCQLDDLRFAAGSPDNGWQWPEDVRQARLSDPNGARPVLTINKLPQHIRLVTNEQRQNRPSAKVLPVDDQGDPEVAEIFNGIIRHIEVNSDADVSYDTACENQVTFGDGYWRILTDYCDDQSFDQDILIVAIRNSFAVYLDPDGLRKDATGKHCRWGFITEELSDAEFKRQFPDAQGKPAWDDVGLGDDAAPWLANDGIRIAEYFCIEEKPEKIHLLEDGTTISAEEYDSAPADMARPAIVKTRETTRPAVKWTKINGVEILQTQEWAGKYIPIVRVVGNEFIVEGKSVTSGLVRNAKDPQRMVNYWTSQEAEMLALAPKAPFIGAVGQFEDQEEQWRQANTVNYAFLQYNPVDVNGTALPPPQRQAPPMPPSGIIHAKNEAGDDLQATVGQYNPSIGADAQEKSGRAIMARQRQADVGTFHFIDNLSRAIRFSGCILLDLIPKIYDTERVARIIGMDGEPSHAKLDPNSPQAVCEVCDEAGEIQKIYNPSVGRYDVVVTTGPSFTTKRAESAEAMGMLLQGNPGLWGVIGDLFVKNQDWPGAEEMATRIRKTIDPKLLEDDEQDEGSVEAKMAKIQQGAQMLGEKEAQLQQAEQQVQMMGQQAQQGIEQAKVAEQKVKDLINELNSEAQRLEYEKKSLKNDEALVQAELDKRKVEQTAAIREAMLQVEKMLLKHSAEVEDAMEQPPDQAQPMQPDVMLAIAESTAATGEAIRQMMQALVMPRTTELQMDEMGNPIGSVSRVG